MLSQQHSEQLKEETLLRKIYRFAKQKNIEALTKIVDQGLCIGIFQNGINAIRLLAKEGDFQSVNFLIEKFNASLNHAIQGYAQGGFTEKVTQLIEQGGSPDYAIRGYALAGDVEQVTHLLNQGASPNFAIYGYAQRGYLMEVSKLIQSDENYGWAIRGFARGGYERVVNHLLLGEEELAESAMEYYLRGGHIEEANRLSNNRISGAYAARGCAFADDIERVSHFIALNSHVSMIVQGYADTGRVDRVNQLLHIAKVRDKDGIASIDEAVYGYAHNEHIDQVNKLIEKGATRYKAASGYIQGGYLKQEKNILRLMSLTNDKELRKLLVEEINENNTSINLKALSKKASKLNKLISNHSLSYHEAHSLTIPGARVWLLQGPALVQSGKFFSDVYWNITSILLGLPHNDAKKVFKAVHDHLFDSIKKDLTTQFTARFWRTKLQTDQLLKESEQRYVKRIKF